MANQPTGRSLMRQLVVDERPGTPNEGLVALQTAELLRTTLLSRSEVPPRPATGAARAAAGDPAGDRGAATPPPPPSAALQAAAGALFSPGAGDAALQAWLTRQPRRRQAGRHRAGCQRPLRASTISGPEGSASVGAWLVGAAVFVRYDRPATGLYAIAAAGGAVIRLDAEATAASPLVANSASTTAGAVYAARRRRLRGDAVAAPRRARGRRRRSRRACRYGSRATRPRLGASVPGGRCCSSTSVVGDARRALRFEANVVDPDVERASRARS